MAQTVESNLTRWIGLYGADDVHLGRLLCDDHAEENAVAILYDGPAGTQRLTYEELGERSRRLAGSLREIGIQPGDRIATLLPKSPELVITLLAIWRVGAVHVPLFTAFGPDAITFRVGHSGARLVITNSEHRTKLHELEAPSPSIMCVNDQKVTAVVGDHDFAAAVAGETEFEGVSRTGGDLMFLLYTSGTTGNPKGVAVPICALASIRSYMHYSIDLRSDDVYWNLADTGWAYGLWFGVTGSLLLGNTAIVRDRPFDPASVFAAILAHGVTNLAGAPTAYRALRAAGAPRDFRERSALRAISSAGEPLNPELLEWSKRELGVPMHDHYGQSEIGMVTGFANHPELHREPIPGSMGFALPGYRVVLLDESGQELGPGVEGEVAIDVSASPLFTFRGYYRDPERTAERYPYGERYYTTADSAAFDDEGLLHFASRADDVITSSGYRIGPFEVESALIAHQAVTEAAVVGTPDDLRGEAVTAFVVTTADTEGTAELAEELQTFVKSRLAKHLYPRHIRFVDSLPRTQSGKVKRRELRESWQ